MAMQMEPNIPSPTPGEPPAPEMPAPETFKPNIYPVMYWALAYGVVAGLLLFLLWLLSSYITIVWFPVFLAGLIWGGFRNYRKQKTAWAAQGGAAMPEGSAVDEFRRAVSDIASASRELLNQEAPPDTPDASAAAQPENQAGDSEPPLGSR